MSARAGGGPLREFLERLEALRVKLPGAAARETADGLTDADPATGEQWVGGQVWAHMAEFVPYWIAEIRKVVDPGATEPVPFGRVKTDPRRIAAIEARRDEPVPVLAESTLVDVQTLEDFLVEVDGIPGSWQRTGEHSKLGTMDVVRMVEEFLVGHLEEHLQQLDGLASADN